MVFSDFPFCYRAPFDPACKRIPIFKFLHFKYKNYYGSVIFHDIGYFVLANIDELYRQCWNPDD